VAALGCLPPTVEPRATEHIDDMKAMIERLVAKGCAYVAEDHVLFHVAAMPDYGVLAQPLARRDAGRRPRRGRALQARRHGLRAVEAVEARRAGLAVALRHRGARPPRLAHRMLGHGGKHLGDTFDIHGGGIDLMFPHHENELAQTRCAFGVERMAQVWMHNGFLQVEGRKMAKSEGNFVTIHDLLHTEKFGRARLAG
jgi:cysteinyl-tRNA synthetase